MGALATSALYRESPNRDDSSVVYYIASHCGLHVTLTAVDDLWFSDVSAGLPATEET